MTPGTSLTVYHPPVALPGPNEAEIPPAVQRSAEILGSLMVGALSGYIIYWINRLIARMGWLGEGAVVQPLPYVLAGIMSAAIVETARLAHDAGLYALGTRDECEKIADTDATSFDRLRQKAWKVIDFADKAQKDIDVIYSRIFNIRTAEEIRTKYTTEKDYYLSDPRFMEVARRAFLEQAVDTFTTAVPQELGVYAVEAMGYTVLGGHLFVWLHGIMFFNGFVDKIGKVYQSIDAEERKEYKRRKEEKENRDAFNTLGALYPDEIAALDAIMDESGEESIVEEDALIDHLEVEDTQEEEGDEIEGDITEDNPFVDSAVFIQGDEIDLRDHKDILNYRHTVFQSTYPIKGFPVDEEEIEEGLDETDVVKEIDEDAISDNFILVNE